MTILDHTYYGPAQRVPSMKTEMASGAFRVVSTSANGCVLGNGESPEKQWFVAIPREIAQARPDYDKAEDEYQRMKDDPNPNAEYHDRYAEVPR